MKMAPQKMLYELGPEEQTERNKSWGDGVKGRGRGRCADPRCPFGGAASSIIR